MAAMAAAMVSAETEAYSYKSRTARNQLLPPTPKARKDTPAIAVWKGDGVQPEGETRQQRRARERAEGGGA
jgi:hypothetical protein